MILLIHLLIQTKSPMALAMQGKINTHTARTLVAHILSRNIALHPPLTPQKLHE